MFEKKYEPIINFIDLVLGCIVLISMVCVIIFFSTYAYADTVSGDDSSISGTVVSADSPSQTVVSSNYVSANTLSGPATYDQGDRIIFLLSLILFMQVFSWCHERIRNGIRSTKNTH